MAGQVFCRLIARLFTKTKEADNRLESIAETLRATLNAVATAAPDWLIGVIVRIPI